MPFGQRLGADQKARGHWERDCYSGALLWNSLPESIRAIRSIGQFKKEINCALETFDSHSAIL